MPGSVLPSLHDAELSAIDVSRAEHSIVLRFILSDGSRVAIRFDGVVSFRVIDLIEQNVVSRIISADNCSVDVMAHWVRWANTLSDGACFVSDEKVSRYIDKLTKGDVRLFVLEPSWGAEVAIVCQRITVLETATH